MNVLGGYRHFADLGAVRPYVDASIGFGGGGDVDTGAGLLLSAGLGAALDITPGFGVLAGVQRVQSTGGDFGAWSPYLRGSVNLGGPGRPMTLRRGGPGGWPIRRGSRTSSPMPISASPATRGRPIRR